MPDLSHETTWWRQGHSVVGLDEVGRGALAGPVVVGAVLLRQPRDMLDGLDDSKKLTARRRERLCHAIDLWADVWATGAATAREIDLWGLRFALAVAATRALAALHERPDHVLVDGSLNLLSAPQPLGDDVPSLSFDTLPVTCIVKGDSVSATIAAASIVAKVTRDAYMTEVDEHYPEWGFAGHKGYGSASHMERLRSHGPTPLHRTSWALPPRR